MKEETFIVLAPMKKTRFYVSAILSDGQEFDPRTRLSPERLKRNDPEHFFHTSQS